MFAGYPVQYQSNLDCYWFITAPDNQRVTLSIRYIDIEPNKKCAYDYLAAFDGNNDFFVRYI